MSNSPRKSIAIIGAGITGLTAAFRLHERGCAVRVFEKSPFAGGAIRSHQEHGFLAEAGPSSVQLAAPEFKQLIADLNLGPDLVTAGSLAKKRFLMRAGRFVAVPSSPLAFLGTPLFSLRTKLALFTELLTRRRVRTTDLSLAEFVRSHFTQELVDYAVNPLIAGIYAGDPEKLSVRHAFPSLWEAERSHGSVLRGLLAGAKTRKARGEGGIAPVVSFRLGLQQLTDALVDRLPAGAVELNSTVETIIPGRPYRLVWQQGGQPAAAEFDAVVFAVPAYALAQLTFGTLGERPLALLDGIPHPPVSSLFLGYRREQVAHPLDGFGGLVPAIERRNVLGILFSSSLFPGRAPAGHVGLTIFAGGMRQPDHGRLNTPQLLLRIAPDLRDLIGVTGDPVFVRHSSWPRAIPQYILGYERYRDTMAQLEGQHPGLFIGGNARDGISLPDCLKSGTELARKTGEFLTKIL